MIICPDCNMEINADDIEGGCCPECGSPISHNTIFEDNIDEELDNPDDYFDDDADFAE